MRPEEIKSALGLLGIEPKSHGWYADHWDQIQSYPLFISFPRTGAHWLNAVIELYLDRPRLPAARATFLEANRDDWLFFHDHDTIAYDKLYIENKEALYLYRDPIPTVFSYIIYNFNNGKGIYTLPYNKIKELVIACSYHYKNHLLKWLINKPARTVIKHENFKIDEVKEFSKICHHFGHEINEDKIRECFSVVTPSALTEKRTDYNALSDYMLTKKYKEERVKFSKEFGNQINSIVKSDGLAVSYTHLTLPTTP